MMTSASASAAPRVEVTILRNTVPLTQDEISRILRSGGRLLRCPRPFFE
jgi:hypothetical protein